MLDNIWEDSLPAVKQFLNVCPKDVRVVMTSRDASAVDELGGTAIDLSELSFERREEEYKCQSTVLFHIRDARSLRLNTYQYCC